MAKATKAVSIDGIEFDALISEEQSLEATVPEYPCEDQFVKSDAILLGQEKISMVLVLSYAPLTWKEHGTGSAHINEAIARLREMYYEREPVSITTTDGSYTDMALESISISKNIDTGYGREVSVSFRKIRTTTVTRTYIPNSGRGGDTGKNAGNLGNSSGEAEFTSRYYDAFGAKYDTDESGTSESGTSESATEITSAQSNSSEVNVVTLGESGQSFPITTIDAELIRQTITYENLSVGTGGTD